MRSGVFAWPGTVSPVYLLLPSAALAAYGVLGFLSPDLFEAFAQEDSWVEWLTFGAFLCAFAVCARKARREGLGGSPGRAAAAAALFCLFVAGEEVSWGQRLLGFVPPDVFLESNYQQEANLHNFLKSFMDTRWLSAALFAAWSALLPVLGTSERGRAFLSRWGLRPPPWPLASLGWVGLVLLGLYPLTLTGEYMELLAGGLILSWALWGSGEPAPGRWLGACGAAAGAGMLLMGLATASGGPAKIECARLEVRALARAVAAQGATGRHEDSASVHKRMYTALRQGYLALGLGAALKGAACRERKDPSRRRLYLLDPWGQAYWLRFVESEDGSYRAGVYSLGPNRRRESTESAFGGDDIGQWVEDVTSRDDGEGEEGIDFE